MSNKILLLLLALLAACGEQKPAGPGAGGMPPLEVEVLTVQPGSATVSRELPGRLEAVRTAQVRARVEGIVEKRLFTEGSDVAAGATLFQLDARTFRTTAASAEADLAVAKQNLERYKALLPIKAVSQQEFDLAEARYKQAEAALAKAHLDLENTTVPAPIAGRIGRAMVTEGALVGKGDATHLATIEQIDPIYVNFTQTNTDLQRLQQQLKSGKLKRGKEVQVELVQEDGTVYAHKGKLLFSELAVDPNSGAIMMRALFPNPQKELLPGTFVRVRMAQGTMENVFKVPQRAVASSPQGQLVMLVDAEGKVAPHPIKTGETDGTDWIVSEGLSGGERVIVNGLQKARPGSTVKPVPLGAAAGAPVAAAPAPTAPAAEKK